MDKTQEEKVFQFKMSDVQHGRSSRHTAKLWDIAIPISRLETRKNFYTARCVQKWNSLPHQVQNLDDLNEFKNAYDKFSFH